MTPVRPVRDPDLVDAVDALPRTEFGDDVWRVVRDGRDACAGSGTGGRWDDGTFDVLYTAAVADGAIAERYFHLRKGQPVFPSKAAYRLHRLRASLGRALELADLAALQVLGVRTERFGAAAYAQRRLEYPRTHEVAEVAHFLGFDGLIVPSARWNCANIVVFTDRVSPEALERIEDCGLVDWAGWAARHEIR